MKNAINLGKQLVECLKNCGQDDAITQWMAHYIAEQIVAAETLTGKQRSVAQRTCFNTILELWRHRSLLSREVRPLAKFDIIASTIQHISPATKHGYYHRLPDTPESKKETGTVQKLMEFILRMDSAARLLIDTAFKEAMAEAKNKKSMEILKNAQSLSRNREAAAFSLLAATYSGGQDDSVRMKRVLRDEIEERIRLLDAFLNSCGWLKAKYEKKLRTMDDD